MIFHLRRIFHFSQEILCAKCLRLSSAKVGAMVVTSALFFLSLKLKESVENGRYIYLYASEFCITCQNLPEQELIRPQSNVLPGRRGYPLLLGGNVRVETGIGILLFLKEYLWMIFKEFRE